MAPDLILQPKVSAFFLNKLASSLLGLLVLGLILSAILTGANSQGTLPIALILVVLWLGVFLLILLVILVSYVTFRKARYELYSDRIIIKSGGIWQDNQTELAVKNITHVDLELPFVEYGLFKTGNLRLRSAGTSKAEICLESLEDPQSIAEKLESLMRSNGFSLSKKSLIREDSPSALGTVVDIGNATLQLIVAVFFSFAYLPGIVGVFVNFGINPAFIVLVLALGLFGLYLIGLILKYFDIKNRLYSVYDGAIYYRKGFLTKHYAFIPLESMADSVTRQNFWQKLFGIYDILLSAKGVGTEIEFNNIAAGPAMEAAVDGAIRSLAAKVSDSVVVHTATTHKPAVPEIETDELVTKTAVAVANYSDQKSSIKKVQFGSATDQTVFSETITFQMNLIRSLSPLFISIGIGVLIVIALSIFFPPALFLLVGFFGTILSIISEAIRAFFTKYSISSQSVMEQYKFLTTNNKEFSLSKVTAVIFKQDVFDMILGTCSIRFLSIGSSTELLWRNIKKDVEFETKIKQALLLDDTAQTPLTQIAPEFTFLTALKANIIGLAILLTGLISTTSAIVFVFDYAWLAVAIWAIVIIVLSVALVYSHFYFQRMDLQVFSSFLHFASGIFLRQDYYVTHDNIRDVATVRYPLGDFGNIEFNIASELIPLSTQQQQQMAGQYGSANQSNYSKYINASKFSLNFVSGIESKQWQRLLDLIMLTKPSAQTYEAERLLAEFPEIIEYSARSNWKPDFAVMLLLCLIFPPLLLVLPFAVWAALKRRYYMEDKRIVADSGIFFNRRQSILYGKIDFIGTQQNFLQKLFKVGMLSVNTAGSSRAVMTVLNVPAYQKFYKLLQGKYR